jgi:pimeloyl-ACP methyl ester carboxylesterase
MFAQMAGMLPAEEQERVKASFANTPQNVLVSAMESMYDDALYATDKINVPVLAILAKSPFWAADTEQFLRSLAPDFEYHMWEGVDHFLHLEKPKEFNETVIAFVNKKNLLK